MTTTTAGRPGGTRAGVTRALPFVALAVAVVLIGLVGRNGRRDGEPLDPRSTGPLGARGLVLLLERFGAEVAVTGELPPVGGTAVILRDRLAEPDSERLQQWVEDGGTLVVADPASSFAPTIVRDAGDLFAVDSSDPDVLDAGVCRLPALREVRKLSVPGAAPYRVTGGAIGCFDVGEGSFVVARAEGGGVVVAVGGGGPFVNDRLGDADNAALAVSLMAPRPGTKVVVVEPSAPGSGRSSLLDLVSRQVKNGLWQLLVAFVIFALWRARRLGRPVLEPQPVQIAGSELVVAVGNLLQQARRRDAAAAMLRSRLRTGLSQRLGLAVDASPEVMAAAASNRAGVDAAAVAGALTPGAPGDDAALVALARSVESLRNEVFHVR